MSTLIIYVHGALSTKNSWNYIRQKLAEKFDGTKDLIKPREDFIKYDLNQEIAADVVEKMVNKLQKQLSEIDRLVLIGHSFGGILSVAAVRKLKPLIDEKKIKVKIITLSSPFAGSEIATVLRMIRPGSMFFKNIGAHTDFIKDFKSEPLYCKTHIFVTTEGGADWMPQANDGVVTVESQTWFNDDPLATHQEAKVNHFEILLSDLVVTQLYKSCV